MAQGLRDPSEIAAIEENDGGRHEIEGCDPTRLILTASIPKAPQAMECDGASKRVLGFALVDSSLSSDFVEKPAPTGSTALAEGVEIHPAGEPTADPHEALAGTMLPFGATAYDCAFSGTTHR